MSHHRTKALLISSALAVAGTLAVGTGTAGASCPAGTYNVRTMNHYAASTGNWYTDEVIAPPTGSDCTDEVLWYVGTSNFYKGQYLSGGTWHDSMDAGWFYRVAGSSVYTAIVPNIVDGAHVRATEYQHGGTAVSIYV
jgi:hypothetical protein